jgi:hypothetical protein
MARGSGDTRAGVVAREVIVPMSSLIRHLTALSDAALLAPFAGENTANTPTAALSDAGRELCAQLFAQAPPDIDI